MSRSRTTSDVLAALLLAAAGAANAVPADLKVSSDDLNRAGEHSAEVQVNKASRAPLQFLGEYACGINDHWQFALKAPFIREDGLRGLGATVEVRYLGAHDRERGAYWGIDLSASREREAPGEPSVSSTELQPVFGYRTRGWHLAANLPKHGFQAKAGTRLGPHEVGLEYFRDQGRKYLFLAWDRVQGTDLNLALGRGSDASERWIVKAIYSLPIGK